MPRALLSVLLVALVACASPQVRHGCPAACEDGQVCDTRYGLCHTDPCNGTCTSGQRCRSSPTPHCATINIGEASENGSTLAPPGSSNP